jgi:uncharacterized protein YbjT (DUF2867 family)
MNLVVGATGMLGTEICRQLAAKGKPVRALVRPTSDPAKVAKLRELGAEIALGDVRNRASLDAACRGATAVISTVSAMPFSYHAPDSTPLTIDQEGVTSLIAAAKAAGVTQFVYTSFTRQVDVDSTLRTAKRTVEKRLAGSGLTYTTLLPNNFMEIWLGPVAGFDYPNARARLLGTGENPVSWISFVDVAQFAVASLDNPAARNAELELGGPEALSQREVVRIFEEVGGRPFELDFVPRDALVAQREAADEYNHSFASLMLVTATHGTPIDMRETLKSFPIKLTSVREYAARVLGQ